MNIVVIAPWFRSLAHLYGEALTNLGHQVLVVTSDRHFEEGYDLCDELVVTFSAGTRSLLEHLVFARRVALHFRPDLALTEPFHHPAWLALVPRGCPQILMLHEPDHGRDRPDLDRKRRVVAAMQRRHVSRVVCFSQYSSRLARQSGWREVDVVPLVSEMPDEWVPPQADSGTRRGFVTAGRLTRNKGLDIAVAAWLGLSEEIRAVEPLTLLVSDGQGHPPEELEAWRRSGVNVRRGRYSFRDAADVVATARAMILPYRNGSQSGAQLFAMQLGCVPLVSDVGALGEYQPALAPPVPTLAISAWTDRLQGELSSGEDRSRHLEVRRRYVEVCGPAVVERTWAFVLGQRIGMRT